MIPSLKIELENWQQQQKTNSKKNAFTRKPILSWIFVCLFHCLCLVRGPQNEQIHCKFKQNTHNAKIQYGYECCYIHAKKRKKEMHIKRTSEVLECSTISFSIGKQPHNGKKLTICTSNVSTSNKLWYCKDIDQRDSIVEMKSYYMIVYLWWCNKNGYKMQCHWIATTIYYCKWNSIRASSIWHNKQINVMLNSTYSDSIASMSFKCICFHIIFLFRFFFCMQNWTTTNRFQTAKRTKHPDKMNRKRKERKWIIFLLLLLYFVVGGEHETERLMFWCTKWTYKTILRTGWSKGTFLTFLRSDKPTTRLYLLLIVHKNLQQLWMFHGNV